MNPALPRFLIALALAPILPLASSARADDLFVASSNTAFARGNATTGNFQILGACGGQAHSLAIDGADVWFGDALGRIYRFQGSIAQLTLFADTDVDATGIAVRGNEILVSGSDGRVLRLDKSSGAVVGSWTVFHGITSMLLFGNDLYLGSEFGIVTDLDLLTGGVSSLGTCGGQVTSMTHDGTHLVIGSELGFVFRMSFATGTLDSVFPVTSDCTGIVVHMGSLLVSGSDGTIRRVNRVTGAPQGTMQWNFDIQTMGIASSSSGNPYCYGITCPCGNSDAIAGCRNSTGVGSYLGGNGSASVSADDLSLVVTNMPPNSMGRLYMGASLTQIPFGDGLLCAGSGGYGQHRFPVQPVSAQGGFTFGPGVVDWSRSHFSTLGQIVPGFTWHFQGWYRNTLGPCGSGFNTTNAFTVTFTP